MNLIITQIAAWIALIGFTGMFCFQFALVLGVRWGHLAWGGKYKKLPFNLRLASLVSTVIFVVGALCIMEKANIYFIINSPKFADIFVWLLVGIFGLSTIGNILSKSGAEKRLMTPIAAILFLSCLIVAI